MGKVVYLIRAAQFYKIGISCNVKKRIPSIQTGCPIKCEYIGYIPHDQPEALERELHLKFQDFRTFGEWFDLGDDSIKQLISEYGLKHQKNPYAEQSKQSKRAVSSPALKKARTLAAEVNEVDMVFREYFPGKCLSDGGKDTIRKLITKFSTNIVCEAIRHLSIKFESAEIWDKLSKTCDTYKKYGRHIPDKLWTLYWSVKKKLHPSAAIEIINYVMEINQEDNGDLINHIAYKSSCYFAPHDSVWDCIHEYLEYQSNE